MLYLERINLGLEKENPFEMDNIGELDDFDSIVSFKDRSDISSEDNFDEDGIIEYSEDDNLLMMEASSSRHFGKSGNPFKKQKSGTGLASKRSNSRHFDTES